MEEVVGFTGTQEGMSYEQTNALRQALIGATELHHGDCIGADAQAHDIAREIGGIRIVIHPPTDPSRRAFKRGDIIREPKPYLERNHDIVDESASLIAAPKSDVEELRSGTWATVRYARKMEKPVKMLLR